MYQLSSPLPFADGDCELLAVGRPIEFVDVGVGWRELAKLCGGDIDEREALLEKILGNDSFIGRLCDERAGCACGVFREQQRDCFRIG